MRVLRVWLYLFVYIDGRVESPGLIWFCKSCASTLTQYFPDFVMSLYKSLHNAVRFATERPCLPSAPRPKLSAAILARCTRAVRAVRQAWASTSGEFGQSLRGSALGLPVDSGGYAQFCVFATCCFTKTPITRNKIAKNRRSGTITDKLSNHSRRPGHPFLRLRVVHAIRHGRRGRLAPRAPPLPAPMFDIPDLSTDLAARP